MNECKVKASERGEMWCEIRTLLSDSESDSKQVSRYQVELKETQDKSRFRGQVSPEFRFISRL